MFLIFLTWISCSDPRENIQEKCTGNTISVIQSNSASGRAASGEQIQGTTSTEEEASRRTKPSSISIEASSCEHAQQSQQRACTKDAPQTSTAGINAVSTTSSGMIFNNEKGYAVGNLEDIDSSGQHLGNTGESIRRTLSILDLLRHSDLRLPDKIPPSKEDLQRLAKRIRKSDPSPLKTKHRKERGSSQRKESPPEESSSSDHHESLNMHAEASLVTQAGSLQPSCSKYLPSLAEPINSVQQPIIKYLSVSDVLKLPPLQKKYYQPHQLFLEAGSSDQGAAERAQKTNPSVPNALDAKRFLIMKNSVNQLPITSGAKSSKQSSEICVPVVGANFQAPFADNIISTASCSNILFPNDSHAQSADSTSHPFSLYSQFREAVNSNAPEVPPSSTALPQPSFMREQSTEMPTANPSNHTSSLDCYMHQSSSAALSAGSSFRPLLPSSLSIRPSPSSTDLHGSSLNLLTDSNAYASTTLLDKALPLFQQSTALKPSTTEHSRPLSDIYSLQCREEMGLYRFSLKELSIMRPSSNHHFYNQALEDEKKAWHNSLCQIPSREFLNNNFHHLLPETAFSFLYLYFDHFGNFSKLPEYLDYIFECPENLWYRTDAKFLDALLAGSACISSPLQLDLIVRILTTLIKKGRIDLIVLMMKSNRCVAEFPEQIIIHLMVFYIRNRLPQCNFLCSLFAYLTRERSDKDHSFIVSSVKLLLSGEDYELSKDVLGAIELTTRTLGSNICDACNSFKIMLGYFESTVDQFNIDMFLCSPAHTLTSILDLVQALLDHCDELAVVDRVRMFPWKRICLETVRVFFQRLIQRRGARTPFILQVLLGHFFNREDPVPGSGECVFQLLLRSPYKSLCIPLVHFDKTSFRGMSGAIFLHRNIEEIILNGLYGVLPYFDFVYPTDNSRDSLYALSIKKNTLIMDSLCMADLKICPEIRHSIMHNPHFKFYYSDFPRYFRRVLEMYSNKYTIGQLLYVMCRSPLFDRYISPAAEAEIFELLMKCEDPPFYILSYGNALPKNCNTMRHLKCLMLENILQSRSDKQGGSSRMSKKNQSLPITLKNLLEHGMPFYTSSQKYFVTALSSAVDAMNFDDLHPLLFPE